MKIRRVLIVHQGQDDLSKLREMLVRKYPQIQNEGVMYTTHVDYTIDRIKDDAKYDLIVLEKGVHTDDQKRLKSSQEITVPIINEEEITGLLVVETDLKKK